MNGNGVNVKDRPKVDMLGYFNFVLSDEVIETTR